MVKFNKRRFKTFEDAAASWTERANSITAELQHPLTEEHRKQMLVVASALQEECKHLRAIPSTWTLSPGATVVMFVITYAQYILGNLQRENQSFSRIIGGIEGDTFYLDLLLWFVLPGGYSEELLGDLNEEYLLLNSTDGAARARAWYRHQVITTIRDCLWKRIERLAAIGTLIDLFGRWFRS